MAAWSLGHAVKSQEDEDQPKIKGQSVRSNRGPLRMSPRALTAIRTLSSWSSRSRNCMFMLFRTKNHLNTAKHVKWMRD